MKKYKVGIIGCGGIANWCHSPFYKEDPRVEVVAVCDIILERAEKFAADHFPGAEPIKEYKKLLELICRNEEKLLASMTDEQKELFSRYTDCVREFQTMTDCLLFQNSFKLGARMMLEVMEE